MQDYLTFLSRYASTSVSNATALTVGQFDHDMLPSRHKQKIIFLLLILVQTVLLILTPCLSIASTGVTKRLLLPQNKTTASINLSPYWLVFQEDIKDQLELALQANPPLALDTPSRLVINEGEHDLWLRVDISSEQASNDWLLKVSPAQLTRITLYFYDQQLQPNLQTTGRVYPQELSKTTLQHSGGYLLPLPLRQGDQSILLNIHHTVPTPIDIQLITQVGLDEWRPQLQQLSGLLLGALLSFVLLQIYLGWQQQFKAFYWLAVANLGWILVWITENKIGFLSLWLAPITTSIALGHVVIGLAWSLFLQIIRTALSIEIHYICWQRAYIINQAIVFLGSLSIPLWSTSAIQPWVLPFLVTISGLLVILVSFFCRQSSLLIRLLIVATVVVVLLSVNLDFLLIRLSQAIPLLQTLSDQQLSDQIPYYLLDLIGVVLVMLVSHTLIEFQRLRQQQNDLSQQHHHQKNLALQLRQTQWRDHLHHQCLQQIQTTVVQLISSLPPDTISIEPANTLSTSLARIHHALQRVQGLAANGSVQDTPFLLKPLLMNLSKECLELCKTKNLKFHVAFDKKLPQAVCGDARLIHRLLHELLQNAINHTAEGDVIFKVSASKVRSTPDHNAIYPIDFLIQDTGGGLPTEYEATTVDIKKTSELLANTANKPTIALGLMICRHLVQLLQGSLQVKSIRGQGSRFQVCLHLSAANPAQAIANPLNDATAMRIHPPAKAGVELALIVDQNRIVQQSLSATLKNLGYKALLASSSADAIDILTLNSIDIIFLDCEIPETNGFETLSALRTMPHHQRVPVIAIATYSQADFHPKAIAGGFNDYIQKPITHEKIHSHIQNLHLEMPNLGACRT